MAEESAFASNTECDDARRPMWSRMDDYSMRAFTLLKSVGVWSFLLATTLWMPPQLREQGGAGEHDPSAQYVLTPDQLAHYIAVKR